MKIYHLRHHRWVKHRKITSKLTFASPVGDAVRHCKADFAHSNHVLPELVWVEVNEPYITCEFHSLLGTPENHKKVYKMVDYQCQDTSTLTPNKLTSTEPLNKELWPND